MMSFFESSEKAKLGAGLLLFCFLVVGFYFLFFSQRFSELEVVVFDGSSQPLWKAQVEVVLDNNVQKDFTERNGRIVFSGLPFGKEVLVKASGKGYDGKETKVVLNEERKKVELRLSRQEISEKIEKTITFVDASGKKIVDLLFVDFYCSGVKLESKQVIGGIAKLLVPKDCSLSVNVSSSGFTNKSYLVEGNGVIRLEEKMQEKGSLLVEISNENVSVEVFVNDSYGALVDRALTDSGRAIFELGAGNYFVVVNSQGFSSFSREVIIEPSKEFKLPVMLSRAEERGVKLKVVDSQTNVELKAKATLYYGTSKAITLEINNERIFEVDNNVLISSDGYLPKKIFLGKENSGKEVLVKLERCANCDVLEVSVVDESKKEVEGAKVLLLDEHGFVLQNFSEKISDEKGKVVFGSVSIGSYFVLVQKYPFSSKFGPFNSSQKNVLVEMKREKAKVVFVAFDSELKPIPFAFAKIFSSNGSFFGTIPLDSLGNGSFEMFVGTDFYVVFSANGFSDYITSIQSVQPQIENKVIAVMEKESKDVSISASSIERISSFTGSDVYRVKFIGNFPSGFERAGVFVVAGDEKNGFVRIKSVRAVGNVLMGSSYSPPKGFDDDFSNLVEENGKWVQITLDKSFGLSGKVEFLVDFVVVKSFEGRAFFSYRAFVVDASGNYYRDPEDNVLGNLESSVLKHGFYADSYKKFFGNECSQVFCSSFYLVDEAQNLVLNEPYEIKTFSNYFGYFVFSSNANYDNVDLRVFADDGFSISSYEFESFEGKKFLGNNLDVKDFRVSLGKVIQNSSFSGNFLFNYSGEIKQRKIILSLVSEKMEIARKEIVFNIQNSKNFSVDVLPKKIPLLEDFDLELIALTEDKEPLRNAFFKVVVSKPKSLPKIFFSETDDEGRAKIKVGALEPNSKLELIIGKTGFSAKRIVLKPSSQIVAATPSELKINLSLDEPEKRNELNLSALSSVQLVLKDVSFAGNFQGLLNQVKMDNFLGQWKGKSLGKEGLQIVVLSSLSESSQFIDKKRSLRGRLYFTFESSSERLYNFEVPYFVEVYLVSPPQNNNCLEVSLKEWKDHVISSFASAEFYVRNNCLSNSGRPLPLKDIRAKIDWKSDSLGSVEVILSDVSGSEAKSVLGKNFSILIERIGVEREFVAKAFFIPKQGVKGKKAEFSIIFDAALDTSIGEQLVGSSNEIKAEIDIVNLIDCIKFSPEFPKISKNSNDVVLEVDSSACGNVDIDFSFCRNDSGCSSGAEGKVVIQPEEFSLGPLLSKKRITITRQEVSGAYGLSVFVKTPGTQFRKLKVIDLTVEPSVEDAFELRRYEINTIGVGSKDSTEIINKRLSELVSVDASVCDWGHASELPWFDFAGAGKGAITFALSSIVPAMKASKLAAQKTAENAGSVVKAAQDSGKVANASVALDSDNLKVLCDRVRVQQSNVQAMISSCSSPEIQGLGQAAYGLLVDALAECDSLMVKEQATKEEMNKAINYYDEIPVQGVSGMVSEKKAKHEYAYFADNSYIIPVSLGIGAVGFGLAKVIANYAQKKTGIALIVAKLDAAAAKIASAKALATKNFPSGDTCVISASNALMHVEMLSSDFKAYSSGSLAKASADVSSFQSSNSAASSAVDSAGKSVAPAVNSGKSFFTPTTIVATYTLTGFFLGGISTKLFGKDPCKERHVANLPDYVINLLESPEIGSDKEFSAKYDLKSAKVLGNYNEQRMSVIFTNNGIKNQEPIYKTLSFNAVQHLHANPTYVDKGNSSFGPFNVPDKETLRLEQKIRVKVNTMEKDQKMPELSKDTIACESMNRIGRTGRGALPKIKLGWGFSDISINDCVHGKGEFYCDATQFSIMLSKRLKALDEFFAKNQNLKCPQNPLKTDYENVSSSLGVENLEESEGCYIQDFSEFLDNKPALAVLIEANKDNISWTSEIPDLKTFEEMIMFKGLLMKDSFSEDFIRDFALHYSSQRFFDTDKWFTELGLGNSKKYGIADLFFSNKISFSNKGFESYALPSPGVYEVYLKLAFENGKRFFKDSGEPNVNVRVELEFLNEPEFNSIFYYLPFNGNVGLTNNSFDRQNYGVAFEGDEILIDSSTQPLKSLNSSPSNAPKVEIEKDTSFFGLNASSKTRGVLLGVERTSDGAKVRFSPSYAMPIIMKVQSEKGKENSAFYSFSSSDQTVDVGFVSSYWSGFGNCLDPQGNIVYKSFEEKPDRAASQEDYVNDWKNSYAVDFGFAQYNGDTYLKTIYYTNPKESFSLKAQSQNVSFITQYYSGNEVSLSNNQEKQVQTMQDIFKLVEAKEVCVTGFGQKTEFFYNPKAIYEKNNKLIEFEKSLEGGKNCIGYQ
ncbi:MAG: hypothetical protein QXD98_02065 [Candidatus Diapherotrites archaeon]